MTSSGLWDVTDSPKTVEPVWNDHACLDVKEKWSFQTGPVCMDSNGRKMASMFHYTIHVPWSLVNITNLYIFAIMLCVSKTQRPWPSLVKYNICLHRFVLFGQNDTDLCQSYDDIHMHISQFTLNNNLHSKFRERHCQHCSSTQLCYTIKERIPRVNVSSNSVL